MTPEPEEVPVTSGGTADGSVVSSGGPSLAYLDGRPPWRLSSLCDAPQPLDVSTLFRLAERASEPELDGGMLVCRIQMSSTPPRGRRWDLLGNPPDPAATLDVDDQEIGTACERDEMGVTLSWPVVTIRTGAKVKLSVTDVDHNANDFAGMDLDLFAGSFPVALDGDHYSASCYGLSSDVARSQLAEREAQARAQVAELQAAMTPRPNALGFGFPDEALSLAQRHIEDVAAHVGWEDPAMDPLYTLYRSVNLAWQDKVQQQVNELVQSLPDAIEFQPGVSAQVVGHSCPRACTFQVKLENGSGTPASVDVTGNVAKEGPIWAVLHNGRDEWLQVQSPSGASQDPIQIPAGESVMLELGEFVPGREPAISRVGSGGVQLLRIRVDGRFLLLPVRS